jgi:hypothetical protein
MTATVETMTAESAPSAGTGRRAAVRTVLFTVERVLFRADVLDVATANAWAGVQADRARALARAEASAILGHPSPGAATASFQGI